MKTSRTLRMSSLCPKLASANCGLIVELEGQVLMDLDDILNTTSSENTPVLTEGQWTSGNRVALSLGPKSSYC